MHSPWLFCGSFMPRRQANLVMKPSRPKLEESEVGKQTPSADALRLTYCTVYTVPSHTGRALKRGGWQRGQKGPPHSQKSLEQCLAVGSGNSSRRHCRFAWGLRPTCAKGCVFTVHAAVRCCVMTAAKLQMCSPMPLASVGLCCQWASQRCRGA